MTREQIAPMEGMPEEWFDTFSRHWLAQVSRNDPGSLQPGDDIFKYLASKVFQVIATTRRIGQAGWSFRSCGHDHCIACLVWADGTHCQSTALVATQAGEQWWPCVVLNVAPTSGGTLPFYCPALAWQNARPWFAHVSRLRCVGPQAHTLPPPAPPLGLPPPAHTLPPPAPVAMAICDFEPVD